MRSLVRALAAAALLCAPIAQAAIVEPVGKNTTVALRRGSTNITAAAIAEACAKVKCTLPSLAVTVENCPAVKTMLYTADGLTRTTGDNVYQCVIAYQSIVTFKAAPVVLPPVDCVVSDWGAWSDPAWLACTGGQQTRALVHYRTIVTQPAHGGAACPSLVETRTETRTCPGTAVVSWTPPTGNTDGTALANLAGFRVVYGLDPSALTQTIQIPNPVAAAYTVTGLTSGTWYFAVKAYTSGGTESANSNIAQKTVQ